MNCTSYNNGLDYGFGGDLDSGHQLYFRNNVSISGTADVQNADSRNNSWDLSVTANSSDFESLNLNNATVARNPDGTLPNNGLFRLNANSDLIDAGVNVGLPYQGNAPDLGAFEKQ